MQLTTKILPPQKQYGVVNSYDLLKFVAVISMIIDHLGLYLFTANTDLRVIGRLAAPIFLFLVGYCGKYQTSCNLLLVGLLLELGQCLLIGQYLPLNILITIFLVRLSLAWLLAKNLSKDQWLQLVMLVLMLHLPLSVFIDFGAISLLMALIGVAVAKLELNLGHKIMAMLLLLVMLLSSGVINDLSQSQIIVSAVMMLLLGYLLMFFKIKPLDQILPDILAKIVKNTSRYSLLIYAAHLLIIWLIVRLY